MGRRQHGKGLKRKRGWHRTGREGRKMVAALDELDRMVRHYNVDRSATQSPPQHAAKPTSQSPTARTT